MVLGKPQQCFQDWHFYVTIQDKYLDFALYFGEKWSSKLLHMQVILHFTEALYQHINYRVVPVILLALNTYKENRVYLSNVYWLQILPVLKFLKELLFSRSNCTLLT